MSEPDDRHEPETPNELRADIAATRAELADTVEQLSAKLDVQARARDEVQQLRVRAQAKARELNTKLEPYRARIAAGMGAFLLLMLVRRSRRRRRARRARRAQRAD